jgi:GTP-binding protein HflX
VNIEIPREQLTVQREKAVLVGVELPDHPWITEDPLDELRGLAKTAGANIVGELTQRRKHIEPGTYIGKGKVQELAELVQATDADVVIFDNDLHANQTRNLEEAAKVKVLDRSELIMDIFATRARTTEARLQVELAQLEYSLPRLKNMWTHLSRYKGGIGLRGPGETQLEEDRRLVDNRIRDLKNRLREVEGRKQREVWSRREEHTVSLVGYTNAGKSTLMNALTGADVYVENKLFSTLDTRTRKWKIKNWGQVLLSDTVGFIRHLPHRLVTSFKATLEEARQARLLLHVVDASNPTAVEQMQAVDEVLKEVGCADNPTLIVLNKMDQASPDMLADCRAAAGSRRCVTISAALRKGLDELADAVVEALTKDFVEAEIVTDAGNGKLLAYLAAHAEIHHQEFRDQKVFVHCHLPRFLLHHFEEPGVELKVNGQLVNGRHS